jgi:uncharacterized protein YggT (Ycf19 family)
MTAADPQSAPTVSRPPTGRTATLGVGRAIVLIAYALALAATIIATIAFVLKLFGANPHAPFAQWVYRSTDPIMEPFRGIFPNRRLDHRSVFDVSLLFAVIVYSLFALVVGELVAFFDRLRG